MKIKALRKYFLAVLVTVIVLFISILVLFGLIMTNQQALVASKDLRYQSYLLADELRQSSDDLTRLVRTYVVTGNPKYEQQFWQVLAIRNGEKPRPQHYERIYWDLMAVGIQPHPDGEAISLHTLMQQAGFTETEFALLQQAQQNSEELTILENTAMNAAKGLFQDEQGNFTIHAEPDLKMARELVHSEAYHQAKALIMQPIDQFFQELDQRTATQANFYVNKSYLYLFILAILIFFVFLKILLFYRGINKLKESEEFLHLVMDNIPLLIFWKDTQLKYLGCNQATANFNQLATHEEIVGKTDFELIWRDHANKYRDDDQRVMTNDRRELAISEQITQADGSLYWIETNKIPLHNANGKVVGILGVVLDITPQKQAELLLAKYNSRLEAEVAAKTEEVQTQAEQLVTINEELQIQTQNMLAINQELAIKNQLLETEITTRQQIEAKLRENEERFIIAMQGANAGVWDWQMTTNQVYLSSRWKEMLGYSDDEISNLFEEIAQQVIHHEDIDSVMDEINAYLEKRKPTFEVIVRLRHKAGHYIWVLTRGIAIWDSQEKPVRLVGTNVDLTEQKKIESELREIKETLSVTNEILETQADELFTANQELEEKNQRLQNEMDARQQAETQLRASEERFALAMQGANDGIWDWQMTTNQVYFSPRWKEMLGYTDDEIQHDFEEFTQRVHSEDLDLLNHEISGYLEKRQPTYEVTVRMQHKAGHYIWILARGIAIWDSQGNPLRFVGTNVDLTAQKQIETELRQAKEAADAANKAKSIFLANMSHELRTPLNGILGYAQILRRDKSLTNKQKEGVAIIQRSGDYLLTLINDILDLSKIEADKVELYPTDFNFHLFLGEIIDLFKMRAEQKGIVFNYIALSHLPEGVRADEKRLRQVLINLLANAVKFTEQGGVTLKIGYHEDKIRFQIEDTGAGIIQEDLAAIFQPFQQSGEGVYKAEGTGLGLAITKRIIEMMGGEIQVESTLGKGSTFWFAVELLEVSDLVIRQKSSAQQPVIIGFQGAAKKILVVDDKDENRLVILNLLAPLGFELIEATNGEEGLQQALATQPDLILTDLVMPVLDGFAMIRQLRKMPAFATLPILAVSASVFEYHQEQSLEAGCNAFIPKPFQAEILLEQLQEHLNLEWKYETVEEENEDTETDKINSITKILETTEQTWHLTAEQANTLYDLAMRGDISGLIAYAEQLIETEVSLHQFGKKIKELASQFNDDEICQLVQPYIDINDGQNHADQ
jgi:PAS domain S-box-containing protein